MMSVGGLPLLRELTLPMSECQERIAGTLPELCGNWKFPALFQGQQDHALCRIEEQWESLMPPPLLLFMLQNDRNATLPSASFIDLIVKTLHEKFDSFFHLGDGQLVFPAGMIQEILQRDSREYTRKYPWTDNSWLTECESFLQSLELTVSVWDMRPTDMFAVCSAIEERHMLLSTVLSPSFSLVGVEQRRGGA